MSNRADFFVPQETIIYRLIMRNCDFSAAVKKPYFRREMGLGPQIPTKKWAHWVDLSSQALSRKSVIKIFGPEPPPFINMMLLTIVSKGHCSEKSN